MEREEKRGVLEGSVSEETEVAAPASVVWEVYRGCELGKLVDRLLPDVVGRVEFVHGDGGVGTVVMVTFPPGTPGPISYMKEVFTKIDDEKRVKEAELIEGGYKELGFLFYGVRLEIIEKKLDAKSSIIRSTVEYKISDDDEQYAGNASLVSTKVLVTIAQAVGTYLSQKLISY